LGPNKRAKFFVAIRANCKGNFAREASNAERAGLAPIARSRVSALEANMRDLNFSRRPLFFA